MDTIGPRTLHSNGGLSRRVPDRLPLPLRLTRFVGLSLAFFVLPCAFAKKREVVQHAPLPGQMMAAKTVFIQNESGLPNVADKAYTDLKSWGRYVIVDSREKADLILDFTVSHSQKESEDSQFVSLYNSQTGAYTYGTAPGGASSITWSFTHMKVIDPKTQEVIWEDQRAWLRKHPATDELIKSLKSRVEEQDKAQ
jgi:hypothetical protein